MLSGEFWDQTIYSPRVETEKAIPLKNNLDPEKYGYYKSPNSAFYTLIRHTKVSRKKEKTVVELVGIPINVAYRINAKDDLQKYLETRYRIRLSFEREFLSISLSSGMGIAII